MRQEITVRYHHRKEGLRWLKPFVWESLWQCAFSLRWLITIIQEISEYLLLQRTNIHITLMNYSEFHHHVFLFKWPHSFDTIHSNKYMWIDMPFVFLLFEYLLGVTTHWYNCSGYRAQMLVMWINTSRIIVFVSGAPATVIYEIGSGAATQRLGARSTKRGARAG